MSVEKRGALSIVLHTHMPYVEGFGTWPFGEEWLWEAIATSYLPLLDVLDRAPLTFSITPVLADQLEADGIADRFYTFIDEVRVETHKKDAADLRSQGLEAQALEIERSATDYAQARDRMEAINGDLIGALAPFVTSTSSATHAILPLVVADSLVRAQVETGIKSHRRRFGDPGWFWLPECAYNDELDEVLLESGVDAVCVDLTDTFGYNGTNNLYPRVKESGLKLVPIDRAIFELAWSDGGYPSKAAYRDSHRLTYFHHRPYANSGEPYDREAAARQAQEDAAAFVAATITRLDEASESIGSPALSVATFDTEFFGHWWFEGVQWLNFVIDEAENQGLEIVDLVDARECFEAVPFEGNAGTSSWGRSRDLSTWDNTKTADMVWETRRAELELVGAWPSVSPRAARELLALQSSDWTFLEALETAGPYPRERAAGHAAKFTESLGDLQSPEGSLRNLAPDLSLRV